MKFSFCCVGTVPLTPSPPVGVPAAPRGAPVPGTRGASPATGANTGHPAGSRFRLWPRATATKQTGFPCLALAGDETLRGIRVRPGPEPRGELPSLLPGWQRCPQGAGDGHPPLVTSGRGAVPTPCAASAPLPSQPNSAPKGLPRLVSV